LIVDIYVVYHITNLWATTKLSPKFLLDPACFVLVLAGLNNELISD